MKYKPSRDLVKYNNASYAWVDLNLVYLPNNPQIVMKLVSIFHQHTLPYHVINDLDAFIEFYPNVMDKTRIIWADSKLFQVIEKGLYTALAVTFDETTTHTQPITFGDLIVEEWDGCRKQDVVASFKKIYCFTKSAV